MKRILAACVLLMAGVWASGQVNGQGGVYVNGVLQGGAAASGANTALSNLADVAINVGLATGAGSAAALSATAPVGAASTAAGVDATLAASNATAGTTNAGAGPGGDINITAGAAARKTSGDANGGNVVLTPGAGIGAGTTGKIQAVGQFGAASMSALYNGSIGWANHASDPFTDIDTYFTRSAGGRIGVHSNLGLNESLYLGSAGFINFSNGLPYGTNDLGLARSAAGVLKVTDGSSGTGALTASGYTAGTSVGMTTVITVRDSGGSADCTITITGGIVTATTCSHT